MKESSGGISNIIHISLKSVFYIAEQICDQNEYWLWLFPASNASKVPVHAHASQFDKSLSLQKDHFLSAGSLSTFSTFHFTLAMPVYLSLISQDLATVTHHPGNFSWCHSLLIHSTFPRASIKSCIYLHHCIFYIFCLILLMYMSVSSEWGNALTARSVSQCLYVLILQAHNEPQ